MSTAQTPSHTEHEVLTYLHVQKYLENLPKQGTPMIMKTKTALTKALDDMSCIPFVQVPIAVSKESADNLSIAGVEAGTLYDPKVDIILEKSIPSSFGKGSETVLDPSYRSGYEIHAKDIGLKNRLSLCVLADVKKLMFPGRKVDLKLYKLAVYETGGHFDWHMDSTHSDKHHATLLIALNTAWEGGDLVLRRNGIETPVDLRPQRISSERTQLQAVVFFTDTEHRVEPVKSGIRIVLQYDVELKGENDEDESKENQNEEQEEEDEEELDEEEEEEVEVDDEAEPEYWPWMDSFGNRYSTREDMRGDAQATRNRTALENVLAIIKELHSKGTQDVAFALQHLYRRTSISAEYLKGSDAALYDALIGSGEFNVSLHPVILLEASNDNSEGIIQDRFAYRYDAAEITGSQGPSKKKKRKPQRITFHIPQLSAILEISRQDYIEHTGNEAILAEFRYFGGGMFVRPKTKL